MNANLKKWAESLSGCDGGNIDAETWLCGIEWGQGSYNEGEYYKEYLPQKIKNGPVSIEGKDFDWKKSLTYSYGRNFAKLWTVIQGGNIDTYKDVATLAGNELFKLNLYPIAFDSTDHRLWKKYELDEITGFSSKYLFNTWCFFNRFPAYVKMRAAHKPKLIICTGVDYLRDFLMCFAGHSIGQVNTGVINDDSANNSYTRTFYWVKVECTLIIVIPFFSGRYGLNSNNLLTQMGETIRELRNRQ
jgi:hypothetical protein